MASKKTNSASLLKQHWPSLVILVIVALTNWWWYEMYLYRRLSEDQLSQQGYHQAIEMGRLKVCIDNNIRPCDDEHLDQDFE